MRLVALLAAGFVAASAPASAQYIPRPMAPIGPLPPESVSEIVRHMGLEPVGAPVRSGPVYFQRAADYYGKPLRVVIDAHRAQVVPSSRSALRRCCIADLMHPPGRRIGAGPIPTGCRTTMRSHRPAR